MARRRQRDLQRYFDGELRPARAAKIRLELEGSPEEQERLSSLQRMRDLLRQATAESVEEVSFDPLWAHVQMGIAANKPLPLPDRLRAWLRRYGLVAASAAAAAVLVLTLLLPFGESPSHNDCDIESLDVDPEVAITIFTSPENDGKNTVIWVDDHSTEGEVN
jgi:anti-sigma factor RsiW